MSPGGLLSTATGDSVETGDCPGVGEVVWPDGDAGLTVGVGVRLVDGAAADPPHAAKSATIAIAPAAHPPRLGPYQSYDAAHETSVRTDDVGWTLIQPSSNAKRLVSGRRCG